MAPAAMQLSGGDDYMQKYQLLVSQQEVLRRRLSLCIPSAAPLTALLAEAQSLSSPTVTPPEYATPWSSRSEYNSTYSMTGPISTQPSMGQRRSYDDPSTEDTRKLCEIHQQIKATLTELLNTESVRSDERLRTWVQGRLMDAEQKIRRQRRRRSSASTVDREFASSIAEHMEIGLPTCKTWA